jgi:hypothetical protein
MLLSGGIALRLKRISPLRLASLSGLTSISGRDPKFESGLEARMKASSEGNIPGGTPMKQLGVGVGVLVAVGEGVGVSLAVGVNVLVCVGLMVRDGVLVGEGFKSNVAVGV